MYVRGLIRSILSLNDLINNKINSKEIEHERTKREKEEEKAKEEEAKKKLEDKNGASSEAKP